MTNDFKERIRFTCLECEEAYYEDDFLQEEIEKNIISTCSCKNLMFNERGSISEKWREKKSLSVTFVKTKPKVESVFHNTKTKEVKLH